MGSNKIKKRNAGIIHFVASTSAEIHINSFIRSHVELLLESSRKNGGRANQTWSRLQLRLLEIYERSALAERLGSCLQHPHHSQTCVAIIHGRLIVDDALNKVCQLLGERFQRFKAWGPHVAGAIIYRDVIEAFGA